MPLRTRSAMRGEMAQPQAAARVRSMPSCLPGGLVDLEFAVHIVQLAERRRARRPVCNRAIDAIDRGRTSRRRGWRRCVSPPRRGCWSRSGSSRRPPKPPGPATQALIAGALHMADWGEVVASLETTRQDVADWLAQAEGLAQAKGDGA